ncbi:hypothetical protein DOY81_002893 [Sarcophaga bullata]|nr:hypothetical protein DOY81_002893 [Sarcophaga bullata]
MNSSHLVTPMNTHQHQLTHHNTHHPHTPASSTSSTMYTKMPTTQSGSGSGSSSISSKYNHIGDHSSAANRMHNNTSATSTHGVSTTTQSSTTSTPQSNNNSPQSSAYKFAPARRLAARQTLRLAIPKQPGDSQHTQFNSNTTTGAANNNSIHLKHSSPSQLPPAPILKRTPLNTSQFSFTPTTASSHLPKSASPLESHQLPNVIQHSTTPACTITPSSSGSSSNKFLRVRNPSITLNSSDVSSTHDLFAFAKEFSSPAVGGGVDDHSPIFAEIASSISPSTASSGSPTNHLNRLFNLSPSTIRNYGNVS